MFTPLQIDQLSSIICGIAVVVRTHKKSVYIKSVPTKGAANSSRKISHASYTQKPVHKPALNKVEQKESPSSNNCLSPLGGSSMVTKFAHTHLRAPSNNQKPPLGLLSYLTFFSVSQDRSQWWTSTATFRYVTTSLTPPSWNLKKCGCCKKIERGGGGAAPTPSCNRLVMIRSLR